MTTFLFAFRAPKNYLPGQSDTVAAWTAYFNDIGDHVEDVGNPVFERVTVGSPAQDTALGGYTLITADDLDQASALAQGCPLLALGGAVEVGVITQLDSERLTELSGDSPTAARTA